MSAISLSSQDEAQSFATLAEADTRGRPAPTSPFLQSNASAGLSRSSFQADESRMSTDRTLPLPSSSSRVNGSATPSKKKPPSPSFQRSRTYSQPYLSDLPNGKTSAGPRSKAHGYKSTSPRPADIKPTRIPKASRGPPSNSGHGYSSPIPNGNIYQYTPETYQSPELHAVPETLSINSSRSNIAVPNRQNPHLLNETPPFKPGSMSSVSPSHYEEPHEVPPRASTDSVERPFEHWYRGEVSRNGGVGELRVGRRQEMLEIANYGHTIRTQAANSRAATQVALEDGWRRRKRADSVSGIEAKRGSLYLDDEHARQIGRVLDEDPPTDIDGEGDDASEVGSASEHYMEAHRAYDFTHAGDLSTVSAPLPQMSYESRSATPTPSLQQRSSSRQQNLPPTRIPAPPRQSSESRVPTPTQISRTSTEPARSSSGSPTPPPVRQRQPSKPTPAGTPTKRGASPAPKKSRTAASKATRAKTLASRKEQEEEAKRRSVAFYPTPAEEDMTMDAIPSWTQPVPRQGNWDEVVLPVVARKKGLDNHYEQADGKPQPKKRDSAIEPAPGTFGFDHSKYRPPRGDPEFIPMDEFGRPSTRITEESGQKDVDLNPSHPTPTAHDETPLPVRHPPPPSPAPFSDYAPTNDTIVVPPVSGKQRADVEQGKTDDDDDGGGCCKCVIM
ncbi:hypothetical protein BDZ94DRAFT_1245945 [Collybia nuda]|uniref:Uncharacterized protein n=1 Tax=Collybia nuda TaxID=64659 RepID=A0A9P5YET7_9AGAR|nr:hypothetical protein BDZ94DRAFT_1245945 [Collybia nuda]